MFTIPLILISMVADFTITSQLRMSKNKYFVVWNDLVFGRIDSKVLIYGTSRARAHINSKILEDSLQLSTYNLGIDGYTFDMEYCRHKLIFESNTKPLYIIQTLDYHTLGQIENLYQYEQFYPYFDNPIILKTIKGYKGFNWFDYHLPLVRYYGSTKEILSAANILLRPSHNKGNRYKGFYNRNQSWTGEFEKTKASQDYLYQKISKKAILLFENYLADMKRKNVKVIFVYTPEYIEGQEFISNRTEIMNIYKEMSKKHQIPFLDYSSDSICLNKAYFYNAEHLNLKGSNLFSKELASDLKKYINN